MEGLGKYRIGGIGYERTEEYLWGINHNLACVDSFMDQNLSIVHFMYAA